MQHCSKRLNYRTRLNYVMIFLKNAPRSPAALGSRNAVGPQMVVAGHVEAGCQAETAAVPGRKTHGSWAGDRDMDRHDMQSEVE